MFQNNHVVGITQKHLIGRICFNFDLKFTILSVSILNLSGLPSRVGCLVLFPLCSAFTNLLIHKTIEASYVQTRLG